MYVTLVIYLYIYYHGPFVYMISVITFHVHEISNELEVNFLFFQKIIAKWINVKVLLYDIKALNKKLERGRER